jgi:hypothetical protein
MTISHKLSLSLAPGFSPVCGGNLALNRLSGFGRPGKPLKRLDDIASRYTGLKPGANENADKQSDIVNLKS